MRQKAVLLSVGFVLMTGLMALADVSGLMTVVRGGDKSTGGGCCSGSSGILTVEQVKKQLEQNNLNHK